MKRIRWGNLLTKAMCKFWWLGA